MLTSDVYPMLTSGTRSSHTNLYPDNCRHITDRKLPDRWVTEQASEGLVDQQFASTATEWQQRAQL